MRKSSFQKTDENSRASRRTAEFGRKSRIPLTALPSKGRRSSSETRGDRTSNIPTFKRSKSQVHLTSAVTPIRAFTPSLPGSSQSQRFLSPYSDCLSSRKSTQSISKAGGRVVKDTRPLADKGFQQQEIQKITSFLCGQPDFLAIAPKGLSLRQLTLKLFVDIVNYLLGFLDENVTVNMTNYVVELPLILKKFGYVGNVNTSWLKTVNTMHSLPHVVGVFSWLVTLASSVVNTDSEAVLEDSLQNDIDLADEEAFPHGNAAIYLQHLLTQYRLWNAADEVGESNEEKRFISELCCRNGVSNEELRKISEDIQNLEVQFNNPKEIAEMETALEEERKYSEILKDHGKCVEYKAQMEEFLHYAETTLEEAKQTQVKEEENLRNLRNNTLQLKELLSHQTMTVEERDELLGKCNEITNMIRANEEFIAAVSNQCYADDIEMAKKRTSVDMKTKACNKIIVMESCVLPELMELHDDQNVLHEGAMERLAAIDRTASQMKFGLQKTLGDLLSKTKELQEELQQAEEKKASVEEEVKQLLQEVQTLEKAISDLKMKSTEETAEMRRSIEQLKISNQAKINCKTLQEAKMHLDKLLEKRKNGKAHIKDLKEKATDFFKKSVAITRNLMDSVSRAEAEFSRKVEERLNVTKDELKRCEGELYEHEV